MMPPQDPGELTKAAVYTAAGGLGLKVIEWLLRALNIGRRERTDEMKLVLESQAGFREELRKDNEFLRTRVAVLEQKVMKLEDEVISLEGALAKAKSEAADAEAELRLLRRGKFGA